MELICKEFERITNGEEMKRTYGQKEYHLEQVQPSYDRRELKLRYKTIENKDKYIASLEKIIVETHCEAYQQITAKIEQAEIIEYEACQAIAEIEKQAIQEIEEKEAEIYALERSNQRLHNELVRNNEKQIAGIENQQIAEKQTEIYGLKLLNQRLYNELANKNAYYLRIRRSLHIRCVCEEFEQSRRLLKNTKQPRIQRWKEMILSNDTDFQDIKDAIKKHGLDINIVPTIASQLFQKINEDVNGDLAVNRDKLLVVEKYFNQDEFKLVKVIMETYPITDVEYN